MLSRFVIAFLPRNKCLLISWLQPLSAVILEPEKMKSATVPTFSPSPLRHPFHTKRGNQKAEWAPLTPAGPKTRGQVQITEQVKG